MSEPIVFPDESGRLLERTAQGDKAAFDKLVARWRLPLFRFFEKSLYSSADAEELCLQTLTKLYFKAAQYEATRPFPAYLFRVARNELISHYRHKQSLPKTSEYSDHRPAAPSSNLREINELFTDALRQVDEINRTALLLHVQQGLAYEEIAEALEISLSAAKARIRRAREIIKPLVKANL